MRIITCDPRHLVLDANLRPGDWRVDDMVADLLAAGRQLQPIGITADKRVLFGFRRAAALLRIAEREMVPAGHPLRSAACAVLDGDIDGVDRVRLQLLENTARLNYSPMEEAAIIHQLRAAGYKMETIAQMFRRTKGWASQRLALLKLPPDVQAMVGEKIAPYEAYLLAQMPEARMRRRVAAMLEAAPKRHDVATQRRRNLLRELESVPVRGPARPLMQALVGLLKGETTVQEFVGRVEKLVTDARK
jgi:ParB-like chromosome segregation protein Spo0J